MLQTWVKSFLFFIFLVPCFCSPSSQNHNPFIPSIPQLLKGVTNCDVRIIWDDLQDFQYDTNSYNSYLPTISVFAPEYFDEYEMDTIFGYYQYYYPTKFQFALNIHQTRKQPCMINLLLIGNQTLLQTHTHDEDYEYNKQCSVTISLYFTMSYHHYLQCNGQWCVSLSNIYTILVTNLTEIIQQNRIKLLAGSRQYVENFAIILPLKLKNSNDLKICVAERTLKVDLSKTICENFNANQRTLIEAINEKWIYSTYWVYSGKKDDGEAEIDPFDRSSNKSIDTYIFSLAARRENKNVTVYTKLSRKTVPWEVFLPLPTGYWGDFDNQNGGSKPYQVFVQSYGLKWLTCYTAKYLGFAFYLGPFQFELWIGFLITMISVIGVSWIYTKFYLKDSNSMSFSPWLFVLGTIFEETSSAPAKIEKKTFYRLSIGIWCLMVAILTNCYNGLMITELNSPLPGIKIESFRDLLCDQSLFQNQQDFKVSKWMVTSNISSYWKTILAHIPIISPYESRKCFRIWSPELKVFNRFKERLNIPTNWLFEQLHFYHFYELKDGLYGDSLSNSDKIMRSFLYPGHAREPEIIKNIRSQEKRLPTKSELNTANQLEITNCPQKSAYISKSEEIEMQFEFLSRNYNSKKFYVGQDVVLEILQGLIFTGVQNTKIPFYYGILIDAGILRRLMVEKAARKSRNEGPEVFKKKENMVIEGVSSLGGAFITLFILWGSIIGLAGITFCFECRRIIWKA